MPNANTAVPPTTGQVIDFIDHQALPHALRHFTGVAHRVTDDYFILAPQPDHADHQQYTYYRRLPNGEFGSRPEHLPLRVIAGSGSADFKAIWSNLLYSATNAVKAAIDEWCQPFDRRELYEHAHETSDARLQADRKRIQRRIRSLGVTVRQHAFTGRVTDPERFIQHELNQFIGPDLMARAFRYAGVHANVAHLNAIIRHPEPLAEAHRQNPNALNLWLNWPEFDISAELDAGITPDQIAHAARQLVEQHTRISPPTDAWTIFSELNQRFLRELNLEYLHHKVHPVNRVMELVHQAGVQPPYSVLKLFAPIPNRQRKTRANTYLGHTATVLLMSVSALPPRQRRSSIRDLIQQADSITSLLSAAQTDSPAPYQEQWLLQQAGYIPAQRDTHRRAWRILANLGRDLKLDTQGCDDFRQRDLQAKAFFYHLRNADFSVYDADPITSPAVQKAPRRVSARREHLVAAMDDAMQARLARVPFSHRLQHAPGRQVSFTINGVNVLTLTADPQQGITAQADDYWLGQPLPDPDQATDPDARAPNLHWSTQQRLSQAATGQVARVLAESWPELTHEGRPVKPPDAHTAYRHRQGYVHLLPPQLADAITADATVSRQLHEAVKQLLDPSIYRMAHRITGEPPSISVYNTVFRSPAVFAHAGAETPATAAIYLRHRLHNATPPPTFQNLIELKQAAQALPDASPVPAEAWPQMQRIPLPEIQQTLRQPEPLHQNCAQLAFYALIGRMPQSDSQPPKVFRQGRFMGGHIDRHTPNTIRTAALAEQVRNGPPPYDFEHRMADYVKICDHLGRPIAGCNWSELKQIAHRYAQRLDVRALFDQFHQAVAARNNTQRSWWSALPATDFGQYRCRPLYDQEQLLHHAVCFGDARLYHQYHQAAQGEVRHFAVTRQRETVAVAILAQHKGIWQCAHIVHDQADTPAGLAECARQLADTYQTAWRTQEVNQRASAFPAPVTIDIQDYVMSHIYGDHIDPLPF